MPPHDWEDAGRRAYDEPRVLDYRHSDAEYVDDRYPPPREYDRYPDEGRYPDRERYPDERLYPEEDGYRGRER